MSPCSASVITINVDQIFRKFLTEELLAKLFLRKTIKKEAIFRG
jgi:hypothetical protein